MRLKKFLYNKLFYIKNIIFISIIFLYITNLLSFFIKRRKLNENYHSIQSDLNLDFNKSINKEIRIAIYTHSLSNGGLQRITSILLSYLEKVKIFKVYLFNQKEKEKDEYKIPNNLKKAHIKDSNNVINLIKQLKAKKIDILLYQFPRWEEIKILNNLKKTKIIFYIHSSICYWIYSSLLHVLRIYNEYKNSKYIISLIPVESNYLFKKWGIESVLFENFMTYDYNSSIVSNLSSKKILLIGRANSKLKRFEIGIQAMEYIKIELPEIILNIISKIEGSEELISHIHNLNLENNIKFVNFSTDPSINFKDASLNIITSISECFPLVLSETKIYGIPNILLGLDYVLLSKNGTEIIYDDLPETLAKVSKKILFNKIYKKDLSKKARKSMKIFNNNEIFRKWKILLLSIYNELNIYKLFSDSSNDNEKQLYELLKSQVLLLNRRMKIYENLTIEYIENLPLNNFSLNF